MNAPLKHFTSFKHRIPMTHCPLGDHGWLLWLGLVMTLSDHCEWSLWAITVSDHCEWSLWVIIVSNRCEWSLCSKSPLRRQIAISGSPEFSRILEWLHDESFVPNPYEIGPIARLMFCAFSKKTRLSWKPKNSIFSRNSIAILKKLDFLAAYLSNF